MRKLLVAGTLGVFVLGITSCGGGHTCDAYRKADYTKYKTEKSKRDTQKPIAGKVRTK